ncbi:MAG TPA: dodecin family protein [Acidimicrobiia bacterium]
MAVAKVLELTSRSSDSFEDAIESGIQKAGESVDDIQTAWVKDQQVILSGGEIDQYQVTLKVTFMVH